MATRLTQLRNAMSENRWLVAIAIGAALLRLGFAAVFGGPGTWKDLAQSRTLGYILVFTLIPLPLGLLLIRLEARDARRQWLAGLAGWRLTLRNLREQLLNPTSILSAGLAALSLALIINTYGSWKRVMARIVPFSWDERLASVDRAIHFGHDPWELLQPILGEPRLTMLFDYLYYTWLPFTFLSVGWLIWTRHRDLRTRGLLGLAFVWLGLGNIVATLISSAGPAYYGRLVPGVDPFAPLMAYLDEVAGSYQLFARQLQEALWWLHMHGRTDIYTGISAMPSVHVAIPALFAFIGWERNRVLGIAFGLYAVLITLATVHLGWHYAIDGYFSVAAVAAYWKLSGRWTGRRPEDRRNFKT